MTRYLLLRLARALATMLGVLTIAFVLLRLSGDPAALLLGMNASPEAIQALNEVYGFDQGIFTQYLNYLGQALRGDFGYSIRNSAPALELILERLPATIVLATGAFAFGFGLAFLLSVYAELYGGATFRNALLWLGSLVQSVPSFLFGILLVLLFAVKLRWLPALGGGSVRHLILPVIALGSFELALYVRLFNVAFGEQYGQDFVRTARSKGLSEEQVLLRHVLPNAFLTILTVAGLNLGTLIGGTVIIETVFNWPGMGLLVYSSVSSRDYPVVQVGLVVISFFFIMINFLVDQLYAALDPRIRA
jgi:peptide/nickel transport system permease protein